MYSYDRRKIARRAVGEDIEAAQEAITAAIAAVPITSQFLREASELFSLMRVQPDVLKDAQEFLGTVTRVSKELPATLNAIDQLDDMVDSYARHARKNLWGTKKITVKDLDQGFVRDLKVRAMPLLRSFRDIQKAAKDAPSSFEVDDFYESPRIQALNDLASRMSELSSSILFDQSEIEDFLELPENLILERLNANAV